MNVNRPQISALIILAAALLLGACTGGEDPETSPTPVPSPTYTCSPFASTGVCTAERAKKEQEQAAAVAASKTAYTAFLAEYNRLIRAGGSNSATPVIRANSAGPYLTAYTGFVKT